MPSRARPSDPSAETGPTVGSVLTQLASSNNPPTTKRLVEMALDHPTGPAIRSLEHALPPETVGQLFHPAFPEFCSHHGVPMNSLDKLAKLCEVYDQVHRQRLGLPSTTSNEPTLDEL